MRAVIIDEPGGIDALSLTQIDDPSPAPGEVVVDVAAAGVNRADVLQRQGHYNPPPGATPVLGLECSGTISAVGDGVDRWAIGDRVCALLTGGGYADKVAVPAGQLAPIPDGVDLIDAGGIVEVAATVWSNVFMLAGLQPGQRLLVHGGGSGIGTMAIQVATALGSRVAVTAGSAHKLDTCSELGADLLINYHEQDFVEELKAATADSDNGPGADVILDNIGAKYLSRNIAALAIGGRLVVIGMQGGIKGELNLARLLNKRGTVMATSLRARPTQNKTEIIAGMIEHVWPLFTDKSVRPITHTTIALEQVQQAHQILDESSHTGKVILTT